MKDVYAVTLTSMHQDMGRLDRIALNLANVTTPGYKREVVAGVPFATALETAAAQAPVAPPAPDASVPVSAAGTLRVLTDARAGTVRVTGQPLDVALVGDGFLEVATEGGLAYTRQGDLHVDGRGRLVTAAGHPVMGMNGEIVLTTRTPAIDAAGRITEPDATTGPSAAAPGMPVAQLKVVAFEAPARLERLGGGLVAAGPGLTVLGPERVQVRQGALENANVDSMHEMLELVQTMRHFESMQKVILGYDELVGTAVRKLGDLT